MRKPQHQSGFAIVELVLVVAVLTAAVLTGWWVYQHQQTPAASTSSSKSVSSSPVANDVAPAPQVQSTSDLDKAMQTLDQNSSSNDDNSDLSQLNNQTTDL